MTGRYFYIYVEDAPGRWVMGHLRPTKGWAVRATDRPVIREFSGAIGRTIFPFNIRHRAPAMGRRRCP